MEFSSSQEIGSCGFSSRCNGGETKPLLEDGDCWSKPRGGLLRDGMRAGQTTTSWAFFVATLSLSFTHSVTPLHALASGCLEPSRGWRGGVLVNFGWTHSGNYFLFGPVALPVELIPTAEGPDTLPESSARLSFVWPLVHISKLRSPSRLVRKQNLWRSAFILCLSCP